MFLLCLPSYFIFWGMPLACLVNLLIDFKYLYDIHKSISYSYKFHKNSTEIPYQLHKNLYKKKNRRKKPQRPKKLRIETPFFFFLSCAFLFFLILIMMGWLLNQNQILFFRTDSINWVKIPYLFSPIRVRMAMQESDSDNFFFVYFLYGLVIYPYLRSLLDKPHGGRTQGLPHTERA